MSNFFSQGKILNFLQDLKFKIKYHENSEVKITINIFLKTLAIHDYM